MPETPVTIYHNPHCSKSRETLRLLQEHGMNPRIILYLETPPSAAELKRILKMLGLKTRDLIRRKEKPYKEFELDDESLNDDQLIRAMVENPILIERPIVIKGSRAALGRPPEKVLEILST